MLKSTFDTYKSTNLRLHNKLSQAQQYQGFLKRIDNIVDRKHRIDRSSDFYMTFLNKSRQKSKQQKSLQKEYLIQLQNKHLLQKIQKAKCRKLIKNNTLHEIHLQERRIKEQEKINEENSKMAQRIMKQDSYLVRKKLMAFNFSPPSPDKGITKGRQTQLKFFDSRIKSRKLPKLITNSTCITPQPSLVR